MKSSLLADIDTFLTNTGMSPYRFGILAAKNGRLVERIRNGGRVWPETEALILQFLASPRSQRSSNRKGSAS